MIRSPLSNKTIYYKVDKENIKFASNLEQFIDFNNLIVDYKSDSFLNYVNAYLSTPYHGLVKETPYKNIYKLLHGEIITIVKKKKTKSIMGWFPNIKYSKLKQNKCELQKEFEFLFDRSIINSFNKINDNLIIRLSGGIDSSSLACRIKKLINEGKIKYNGKIILQHDHHIGIGDELFFVKLVAESTNYDLTITEEENEILLFKDVNHLKKNLEPEFSVFLNNIDEIDIKNVSFISGSGCDQLFISSPTYISNYIKKFKLVTLYKEAVKISKIEKKSLFYVIIRYGISPLINKNYKFIDHSDFIKKCICKEKIKPKALKKKLKKMLRLNKVKTPHEKRLYTNLMFADQWTNTGNSILDVRMPFVDYELVEFCLFLNNKYKTNEGFTKYILRETMKNIIPNEILQRKDKGTLENSIARSIETSWEALLSITEINYLEKAGILRAGTIRKFLYLLKSSSSVYAYQMIMILELEFWLKSINGIIYKEA